MESSHFQTRLPDFMSRKVVIKSAMAGRFGMNALLAIGEKAQRGERSFQSFLSFEKPALDGDWIARKRKADDGNRARPVFARGVGDEAVFGD